MSKDKGGGKSDDKPKTDTKTNKVVMKAKNCGTVTQSAGDQIIYE